MWGGRCTSAGFLEALVRLATIVPLPTTDQLESAGCNAPGQYLTHLEVADDVGWQALRDAQRVEWGDVPAEYVGGDMETRLDHLIDFLLHKIKGGKAPKDGEYNSAPCSPLTRREFCAFARRAMGTPNEQIGDAWVTRERQIGEPA